jgi:hypothetical protein
MTRQTIKTPPLPPETLGMILLGPHASLVSIIGNERADELSLEGRESILALEGFTADDLIREQLDYSARMA